MIVLPVPSRLRSAIALSVQARCWPETPNESEKYVLLTSN